MDNQCKKNFACSSVFWCIHLDCPSYRTGLACDSCVRYCTCDACVLQGKDNNVDTCSDRAYHIIHGYLDSSEGR